MVLSVTIFHERGGAENNNRSVNKSRIDIGVSYFDLQSKTISGWR